MILRRASIAPVIVGIALRSSLRLCPSTPVSIGNFQRPCLEKRAKTESNASLAPRTCVVATLPILRYYWPGFGRVLTQSPNPYAIACI